MILSAHAVPILLKQHSEWQEVYIRAAGRLLNGGDVYRFADGYSYPPFMAWLAIPFTALSPTASRMIWFGINVGCLIALWRMAWRMTGGRYLEGGLESGVSTRVAGAESSKPRLFAEDRGFPSFSPGHPFTRPARLREHLVCFLGLACSARYVLNGIAHQQTDVVISALLLLGCWRLSRNRDWSAASCFGLAAAMKCTALLWLPYLLWRRKWRAAAWLMIVAVGVNLLPNLVRAPERRGLWLGEWLTRYVRPLTAGDRYPGDWGSWIIYNQSLAGAGNRWLTTKWAWHGSKLEVARKWNALSPMMVGFIVYGAEVALCAAVAFILIRRRAGGRAEFSRPTQMVAAFARMRVSQQPTRILANAATNCEGKQLEIMEYSVVLLLMVLLSPMSSKPHFSTLVLPGFALARLAIYQGDMILRCLLAFAVVLATLSLPVLGGHFDFIALWFGSDTWNALALLVGAIYVLLHPFDIPILACHHGLKQRG